MSYITVNLDPLTYQWLPLSVWVAVLLAISVIGVMAYHFVDQYRTPEFSKRTRDAHRNRKAGMLLVGDDGYGDYEQTHYAGSEGWSETKERGKPKHNYIGFMPRPGKVPEAIPVAPDKKLAETRELAEFINFLNTRKIVVRGSNNPLWIGVKSKALLASILAISGIQLTEKLEEKWAEISKLLCIDPVSTAFPIDVSAMKRMVVSSSYNSSQVIALTKIHEKIGEEKKPDQDRLGKWVIILGIALVITGAALCGIAALA